MMAMWEPGKSEWVWDNEAHSSEPGDHSAPIFIENGKTVVLSLGGHSNSARFEATTGRSTGTIDHSGPFKKSVSIRGMAQSKDGRQIATLVGESLVRIQDAVSGEYISEFPVHGGSDRHRRQIIRFSPDARRLVTPDDSGHAYVWEIASGQLAFTLTYPAGHFSDVHFGAGGRTLITANHREVMVWELAPEPSTTKEPWIDLGQNAPKAEQARRVLLAHPGNAIALIQTHLKPVAPIDEQAVRRSIRNLESDEYRVRERVVADLRKLGRRAVPLLSDLQGASTNAKERLAALKRDLEAGPTTDELRDLRAIEVLEQIDSATAWSLIDSLAKGDPGAVLTEEAQKTITRYRRAK
jgi:hypothetical protein